MITRRQMLQALGLASAAIVVPELIVEPHRKVWQVGADLGRRTGKEMFQGLAAWLPEHDDNIDAMLFGVDRSGSPLSLAGIRVGNEIRVTAAGRIALVDEWLQASMISCENALYLLDYAEPA